MDRKTARAHAMKLIYEWEMGGDGGEDTRIGLLDVRPDEREVEYMNRMYEGVVSNVNEIDGKISEFSRGWTLERITRVDLAILRLGTYELMLGKDPAGVVINEAVELANEFSTDKAGAFINGVLGNISRSSAQ
jgi:N utilization substance protein B